MIEGGQMIRGRKRLLQATSSSDFIFALSTCILVVLAHAFFGGGGADGSYGLVSQLLSLASRYFLFPLCAVFLSSVYFVPLYQRPAQKTD